MRAARLYGALAMGLLTTFLALPHARAQNKYDKPATVTVTPPYSPFGYVDYLKSYYGYPGYGYQSSPGYYYGYQSYYVPAYSGHSMYYYRTDWFYPRAYSHYTWPN